MAPKSPPEVKVWELIYNHIVLPARLPGSEDDILEHINRVLAERLYAAAAKIAQIRDNPNGATWESLRSSLYATKAVNSGPGLDKISLSKAFKCLEVSQFLAVYVKEQNAAIILRRISTGQIDSVIFESFETSARSGDVLSTEGALIWDLPGRAVAIPYKTYIDDKFIDELAMFLAQASSETIKRFAARTAKAGSFISECRDPCDPALITTMLMTILEVNGRRVTLKVIRKRVHDEVSWSHGGGKIPWRRSPFWFVLRVAAQRHLACSLSGPGRVLYKVLMSQVMATFLFESTRQISIDLSIVLKTKLCRRLVKLEDDLGVSDGDAQYISVYNKLKSDFEGAIQFATDHIDTTWRTIKADNCRKIPQVWQEARESQFKLRLPNSQGHINRVLNSSLLQMSTSKPWAGWKLPQDYMFNAEVPKESIAFSKRYFALSELELEIETSNRRLLQDMCSRQEVSWYEQKCLATATKINDYIEAVGKAYQGIPEQRSAMLLTIMELWMVMDKCVLGVFVLLNSYHPAFPADILDVLQLPRLSDMRRSNTIRTYLQSRAESCSNTETTIFVDPREGCFAQRYFDGSPPSSELRHLYETIKVEYEETRDQRELQWERQSECFRELSHEFHGLQCFYGAPDLLGHQEHIKPCRRCTLNWQRHQLQIQRLENPLPSGSIEAKVVIFELLAPETFTSYRDATWNILSSLAYAPLQQGNDEPKMMLKEYGPLKKKSMSKASKFVLASGTKPFLNTHYNVEGFPVYWNKVSVPCGLNYKYFGTDLKFWAKEFIPAKKPSFVYLCQPTMPASSPYAFLNKSAMLGLESNGPSSYVVVASQTKCPVGMNPLEFSAVQTLYGGKRRRWAQILVELGGSGSGMNLSTESASIVMSQLALQIGPMDVDTDLGIIHRVFSDEVFCRRLIELIKQRLEGLSTNWRETFSMDILITLSLRLYELGSKEIRMQAKDLLSTARLVTSRWITSLRQEIQTAADAESSKRCSQYAFWSAILCRRTFSIVNARTALGASSLQIYIKAGIALQDNLISDPLNLPQSMKKALIRDLKMVYAMREELRTSLNNHSTSFVAALKYAMPALVLQNRPHNQVLMPKPNEMWIHLTAEATEDTDPLSVHFHLLEGHLLVNGKPAGKLDHQWTESAIIRDLFGDQNLQIWPSDMPGMLHMLALPHMNQQIHLGFRNGEKVIRTRLPDNKVLELIDRTKFGQSEHSFDLPAPLVDGCYHWLDAKLKTIEIRPRSHIWKSRCLNWLIDLTTGVARRLAENGLTKLLCPNSDIAKMMALTFIHFEQRRHLTIFLPPGKTLTVELRRLELNFFVNENRRLECPQLKSEIDADQDAGTWYGLQSMIVLREVKTVVDPLTNLSIVMPLERRSILVPLGEMRHIRRDSHVALRVDIKDGYAKFNINKVLGRLDCPVAEPTLLYLKAMYHAYTSFALPDSLTGRTGTEEAIHLLKSGLCKPRMPLDSGSLVSLKKVAALTPIREYYPPELKVMEVIHWDVKLSTCIQHDDLRRVVATIVTKSNELARFSKESSEAPPLPLTNEHLASRGMLRRNCFERLQLSTAIVSLDATYAARDSLQPSLANSNVNECTQILRTWPTHFSTSHNIAETFETWAEFNGGHEPFQKSVLTDILDVDLATEWGSLITCCRGATKQNVWKLMFMFAAMSFQQEANMPILRTLLAFALLPELQSIQPPECLAYHDFQLYEVPPAAAILALLQPHLVPFERDEQVGNSTLTERTAAIAAEGLYKQKQREDAEAFASHLLKQWPCAKPAITDMSDPVTLHTSEALLAIYPVWLHYYQNFQFSEYLHRAQKVLDKHHSIVSIQAMTTSTQKPHILPSRVRGVVVPRLAVDLLPLPAEVMEDPFLPDLTTPELDSLPGTSLEDDESEFTENIEEFGSSLAAVESIESVSSEIEVLGAIFDELARTDLKVQKQYIEDNVESLKALMKKNQKAIEEKDLSLDYKQLLEAIGASEADKQMRLHALQEAFERDQVARVRWLQAGGLWPAIEPIDLLETLRSISHCKFGANMKESLIKFGLSITVLQRLYRIKYTYLRGNHAFLQQEMKNSGHENWDPLTRPDFLLLEIDSNILIRPTQIEVAEATISPASGKNSVLQLNMGQGKTSCIIPMAATVLADGNNLVRVVVPKALLMQTSQLLHDKLGGLLGREIRHIPFSRKTPTDGNTISMYWEIHKNMRSVSGVMITLPEHLLSFKLSGLQRLVDNKISEATPMIKIQNWLVRFSRDILDECDNLLALRTQLIYPSGNQKTVDGHPHRWVTIEKLLGMVSNHLDHLASKYPNSIEVVSRGNGGFPVIYFLRKDVEDELIALLVDDIHSRRVPFFPETSLSTRKQIKEFISERKVSPDAGHEIASLFPEIHAATQTLFHLRGLLVQRILLMGLKKRWNVQYGIHPGREPIAVPFRAKGCPSDQSEWGHPDVAILLTCLSFYYEGLSISHLRQTLGHILKSDDPSQIYNLVAQTSNLPSWLRKFSDINVDDESQLLELLKYTKFDVTVIDYFLNTFVFPKYAKQFSSKLQSSGWDIPSFLPSNVARGEKRETHRIANPLTTGFSGTNDWKRMLPLTIAQRDLESLADTSAEVLTTLLKKENRSYVLAADERGKHLTEVKLLHRIKQEGIKIFIDAGAQILEMDNQTLARNWLEVDDSAKAALFFDEDDRPWLLYRAGGKLPLLGTSYADDLSECLVYLDEVHTRGVDLKLPQSARGALTLGLGQTRDHTVQAAMRLRQLATTQSVTFFAPPEVNQSILDLRKEGSSSGIDSADVISWLLQQTCLGIATLQPLYYAQAIAFCVREQASFGDPNFVSDARERERYLREQLQPEQHKLEDIYGTNSRPKTFPVTSRTRPELAQYQRHLTNLRRNFQDDGSAVHGSALQEVEQERENENEVEVVRQVQNPLHYTALKFPGIHPHILTFASSGRLVAGTNASEPAISSMHRSSLGRKYNVSDTRNTLNLHVSTEFTRTVEAPRGRTPDHMQRNPTWIVWSPSSETALIVIPEEAEELLRLLNSLREPPTYLLTYSAPVTKKMNHFNDLDFYAVPSLPEDWKAPLWLKIQLGIFAGRLYFDFDEYQATLDFLGIEDNHSATDEGDVPDNLIEGASLQLDDMTVFPALSEPPPVKRDEAKTFAKKPLSFLQEWVAMRRKGQDFSHTPIGFICQGKPLLASYYFFASTEVLAERTTFIRQIQPRGPAEQEDEVEEDFYDEDAYGIEVAVGEEDHIDDAQLALKLAEAQVVNEPEEEIVENDTAVTNAEEPLDPA